MAHRIDGRKLGRATDHRLALFRNQVTDLLKHEKIITTEAKAREVKGLAEKMITLGKRGDLHARRRARRFVYRHEGGGQALQQAGPALRLAPGWLQPSREDRAPAGRRREDGAA
jgi:large subunit ribosomal protein L17